MSQDHARSVNPRRVSPRWWGLIALAAILGVAAYLAGSQDKRFPTGIVIHHSASPGTVSGRTVGAAIIDRWHANRGFGVHYQGKTYHIGYHYVILADGRVEAGRPEQVWGRHSRRGNNCLGICLVGNFSTSDNPGARQRPAKPTAAQMAALRLLSARLLKKYRLPLSSIRRHSDLDPTDCPGNNFPFDSFIASLASQNPAGLATVPIFLKGQS